MTGRFASFYDLAKRGAAWVQPPPSSETADLRYVPGRLPAEAIDPRVNAQLNRLSPYEAMAVDAALVAGDGALARWAALRQTGADDRTLKRTLAAELARPGEVHPFIRVERVGGAEPAVGVLSIAAGTAPKKTVVKGPRLVALARYVLDIPLSGQPPVPTPGDLNWLYGRLQAWFDLKAAQPKLSLREFLEAQGLKFEHDWSHNTDDYDRIWEHPQAAMLNWIRGDKGILNHQSLTLYRLKDYDFSKTVAPYRFVVGRVGDSESLNVTLPPTQPFDFWRAFYRAPDLTAPLPDLVQRQILEAKAWADGERIQFRLAKAIATGGAAMGARAKLEALLQERVGAQYLGYGATAPEAVTYLGKRYYLGHGTPVYHLETPYGYGGQSRGHLYAESKTALAAGQSRNKPAPDYTLTLVELLETGFQFTQADLDDLKSVLTAAERIPDWEPRERARLLEALRRVTGSGA